METQPIFQIDIQADFKSIYYKILDEKSNKSKQLATRFSDSFIKLAENLVSLPFSGQYLTKYSDKFRLLNKLGYRSMLLEDCVLVYLVVEESRTIELKNIFYQKQDFVRRLIYLK